MVNNLSLIPLISASIAGAIGLFFIWIFFYRRQHVLQFVFGITALAVSLYGIGTCVLYNATNLATAEFWQRTQMIASIIFIISFHAFITFFTKNKISKTKSLIIVTLGLSAILCQIFIRSSLTWKLDEAIAILNPFFGRPYIFTKIVPGFLSIATFFGAGILYIDILRMLLNREHFLSKKNAGILFITLMIIFAFLNDTLVTFRVYQFIYLLDISFLFLILYFSFLLTSTVFDATFNKESLEKANLELEIHRKELEKLVTDRTREFQYQAEFFRSLVENSPIAIVTMDNEQRVTNCNAAFEALFGYNLEEARGQDLDHLIASEEVYQEALKLTRSVLNREKITSTGFRKRKDGSMVNVQIAGVPVIVNGEKSGVLGLYQDITDRNRAEQILRESEVRYRSLFEDSPISLWEEDFSDVKKEIDQLRASGVENFAEYFSNNIDVVKSIMEKIKIVNVNSATIKLFKAKSKEKFYCGLNYVIPLASLSVIADEFSQLANGNTTFITEIDQRDFNGKTIHAVLRLSIAPGYEKNWGKVFVSIIDITERKINESFLKHLSTHDQLTGLANRTLMFEMLNHALANSKRSLKKVAVLFIDLDGFKAINDQFGHAVGDEFLILTADRLRSCLRESDTIARVGGDEFIAILENLEEYSNIEKIADKLLKIVSIPHPVFGNSCCVTTSIGISMYPANGSDPEQLISHGGHCHVPCQTGWKKQIQDY